MTPVSDYDFDRAINYKDLDSVVDMEHDIYGDQHRYDLFHRAREQYGRDQRCVSSERRRYPRSISPNRVDESDMRYHLSKHRNVNSLRSVVSHDLDRGSSRRDSERGISDRLRGRIKLPGRSTSPLNERDWHHDRERERENIGGRLSPRRLQGGRVQDRIKERAHEDLDDGGIGFRGPRTREMYDNNVNFAGPKSLSELRGRKSNENNKQELPLGKRKYSESHQKSENEASFEGPKPLSEILKRKRGDNGNEEDSKGEAKASKEVGEDSKSANVNEFEMEEGLIVENDEVADQENEEAYAEEGEYEYEQGEGEDYIEEEGENVEEGDYVEDDDGDDFAKKIGVMFS